MKTGQDVRELVTGRTGVVLADGRILFPCLRGNLQLNGLVDDGIRATPWRMLEVVDPPVAKIVEVLTHVLQTAGQKVQREDSEAFGEAFEVPELRP